MAASLLLILFLVGQFAALIYGISTVGRRPKDYPPGPRTVPLFGNLLQVH